MDLRCAIGAPVTCKPVQGVHVTAMSYATEPDATTASNQVEPSFQRLAIMEIATVCDANTVTQYVRARLGRRPTLRPSLGRALHQPPATDFERRGSVVIMVGSG